MSEITEQTSKPDISKILQGKLQEIQNKIKEREQAEQQKETNEGGWETVESSTIPKNATTGKKLTQTETNAFQTILNLAKPKDSSKENEEKQMDRPEVIRVQYGHHRVQVDLQSKNDHLENEIIEIEIVNEGEVQVLNMIENVIEEVVNDETVEANVEVITKEVEEHELVYHLVLIVEYKVIPLLPQTYWNKNENIIQNLPLLLLVLS
eukprot:UN31415